jgi:hypothetical protein
MLEPTFFQNFGINGATLKQLCADKEKYDSAKYFISSLETVFNSAGIDVKQINSLVQKHQYLLFENKGNINKYLDTLEKLFDVINPTVVSGIQPINNSSIYASQNELNNLISKEQSKSKKINIVNPEIITDEKDRKTLINRLNGNTTKDERIQKYLSRRAGKKTMLYERYSELAGEGQYMKAKLGKDGRRIIYKVEPTEDITNIKIIYYAKTHNVHDKFMSR